VTQNEDHQTGQGDSNLVSAMEPPRNKRVMVAPASRPLQPECPPLRGYA
jgi:hypothetical protein